MSKGSLIKNLLRATGRKVQHLTKSRYGEVNIGWMKLKYYKHLPPGPVRTHSFRGKSIAFTNPAELLHAFEEIFIDKIYKLDLPQNAYIIDCGANIGISVIYLKLNHPKARLLAFEPDAKNFKLLEQNVQAFDFQNIELRQQAVWVENTTLQFASEGTMSSKISEESDQGVKVDAIRLKDLLTERVDFLKIDIEGAEYNVIIDIAERLSMVKNLFVEYHGSFDQNSHLNELLAIFSKSGFRYYIKEATSVYSTPFTRQRPATMQYDLQLNIFCFR